MSAAIWLVGLLVQANAVKVVSSGEKTAFGKDEGFLVTTNDALALEVTGPTALVLDLRAGSATEALEKDAAVSLVVLRDEQWRSEAAQQLKPLKGQPKGYTLAGKVGLTVAAGAHRLRITTSAGKVVVIARPTKKLPPGVVAMIETEVGANRAASTAPATAPAASASAPAPSPAKADEATAAFTEVKATAAEHAAPASSPADSPARATQALRVAVYDFELSGIDAGIGSVVTDSMLTEVRKLTGVSAIGMAEIRDMLSHEANKQFMGCEESESCLAEIAGALGVDELVSGKLSRVSEGVVFLVRRIDQGHARVLGVVDRRLQAGSGEEFLAAVGPAVEQLYPDRALREGASRGVPKEMALRLNPPPLRPWIFWSATAATAVAALAGGTFGLLAKGAESRYQDQATLAKSQVIDGAKLMDIGHEAERNADLANYSFIGAGVFALTSGLVALFTDWYGYGDAAAAQR